MYKPESDNATGEAFPQWADSSHTDYTTPTRILGDLQNPVASVHVYGLISNFCHREDI